MRIQVAGNAGAAIAILLAQVCGVVSAAEAGAGIETITVTATRLPTSAFEVPASIDLIDGDDLHGSTMGVNLSEALPAVAGLIARDRQNFAQDTQISIRGFGSRSTFGVRGVRLYLDGIPATQPDGQGQVSHFNLGSAQRVEVLRGPFSAMYGNSSGGVIQMFSADGSAEPVITSSLAGGSFGSVRGSLGARGRFGEGDSLDYNLNASHFQTDGFRDHSEARRESFNGKLGWKLSSASKLSFVFNSFSSPDTQDPLGLTRAQFDERPRQAAAVATQFDTRKSASQNQGGVIYDLQLSDTQSLRLLGYYGHRDVEQYLAIPAAVQGAPKHSGGVVDLGTDYGGTDARWAYSGLLDGRRFSLVAGLSYDDLSQQRRGYENFVGSELGIKGALRRDEIDKVYDFDQYLQASYDFAERWSALAGVRHSKVAFDSNDRYIVGTGVGANLDDSGKADFSSTNPVAGLLFRANEALRLYASYGRGFETPTFAELGYRADGGAGLAFDLDPARSNNTELGAKLRLRPHTSAELALFEANTDKELAVATNSGGRSTYRNIDHTRRRGLEASLDSELAPDWRLQIAYTWLDATVRDPYEVCSGTPCTTPNANVAAGNRIPGTPENSAYAQLNWGDTSGWNAAIEARYIGRVAVNDLNSEFAPSYTLLGIDGGYRIELPHWQLRGFVRIDNLLDQDYVGSVIVNDGNGRYYEPGPGRSMLAGINLDWKG